MQGAAGRGPRTPYAAASVACVSLTPRELATRAYTVGTLVAGWSATVLVWPDETITGRQLAVLGGCALAAGWTLRGGVRLSGARHYVTLEDFVLVPLVLIYPAGWVMAVGALSSAAWLVRTRTFQTRWYRVAFNSGNQALLALVSSRVAAGTPGDGALGVVLSAAAAALTWDVLSALGSSTGVFIERGGPATASYQAADVIAQLRVVPVLSLFGAVVYEARTGDWPVLLAALIVVLVQQLLANGTRAGVIAAQREAEREQLLGLVVGAGDRQRREVTSQIHDGPLQVVVATKVLLDSMTTRLKAGATTDEDQLRGLSRHLSAAIDELRSTLHDGYRDRLVVAGVRDGLTEILREHAARFPSGFDLAVDDQLDLTVDSSVVLLMILREAIVNAAKHSHAQSVSVSVCAADASVVGEVVDDGIGIEGPQTSIRRQMGHLGIALMYERAERAGGATAVERLDTGGTRVRVTLPMSPVSQRPLEDWEHSADAQPRS
jgi:signal transduction histidine kinase